MTIQQDLETGEFSVACDGCACEEAVEASSFREATLHVRESEWTVRKVGNDWEHYCGDCDRHAASNWMGWRRCRSCDKEEDMRSNVARGPLEFPRGLDDSETAEAAFLARRRARAGFIASAIVCAGFIAFALAALVLVVPS